MSTGFIAVLFGLGVGAWVFNKASRRTGNNTRSSLILAFFVGLIAAFVIYTLVRFIFK